MLVAPPEEAGGATNIKCIKEPKCDPFMKKATPARLYEADMRKAMQLILKQCKHPKYKTRCPSEAQIRESMTYVLSPYMRKANGLPR